MRIYWFEFSATALFVLLSNSAFLFSPPILADEVISTVLSPFTDVSDQTPYDGIVVQDETYSLTVEAPSTDYLDKLQASSASGQLSLSYKGERTTASPKGVKVTIKMPKGTLKEYITISPQGGRRAIDRSVINSTVDSSISKNGPSSWFKVGGQCDESTSTRFTIVDNATDSSSLPGFPIGVFVRGERNASLTVVGTNFTSVNFDLGNNGGHTTYLSGPTGPVNVQLVSGGTEIYIAGGSDNVNITGVDSYRQTGKVFYDRGTCAIYTDVKLSNVCVKGPVQIPS